MNDPALQELSVCIDRVHTTGDTKHTLADGMSDHLSKAFQEWDGEDAESSLVLGVFFFYRYLAASEPTDMRSAVMALTPCLLYGDMALPPDMIPILVDFCVCEAELLRRDARDSPEPALAERAAHAWQRVVAATDDAHPQFRDRETNMIRALRLVNARRGDTAGLDQAVAIARRDLVPREHRDRDSALWDLYVASMERYEATGNTADHDVALECVEELAARIPSNVRKDDYLMFLCGEKLYQRFLRNPNTQDLHRAIGYLYESVSVPDPEQPTRLLLLARALHVWSLRTKDLDALNEAIARAEQAYALVDRTYKDFPLVEWELSALYFRRYGQTGLGDDLDKAEAAITEASQCLPREVRIAEIFSSIELAQYKHTGNSNSLYNALKLAERVLRILPADDHYGRAEALYQLSQVQRNWYERMGSIGDLDGAVENGQAAIDLLATGDLRRSELLRGLGRIYLTRAMYRGERDALPMAIDRYREAAAIAPDDHRSSMSLVHALQMGYTLTNEIADLDEAIALGEQILEHAAGRSRLNILLDLCTAYRSRFTRTHDADDLHRARTAIAELATLPDLPAETRMRLRLDQAELASFPEERLASLEAAVEQLPQLSLRRRYHEDSEFELAVYQGLGAKAAEAAVAVGRPDRALELLEQARGILTDTVRGARPRPPTSRDLCRNAAGGPIITVSTTETGGLALLVTPQAVIPVPLPSLTLNEARQREKAIKKALASQAHDQILEVLAWLWHAVARPVLDALTAAGWNGSRLWWCPAGVLALLPLHAAGDGHDSVMDRAVSSYLPTVRAMPPTRPIPAPAGNALAVAMTRTPGEASLPGAASEAHSLTRLLGATILQNEQATRDAVISALPDYRIVHFACHAQANTREPTLSRLLLHDQPLTPRDLLALRLDADLAYLSACATSDVHFVSADEALHITAAFHLAGFRHVVGTLWPVDDHVAADTTDRFYTLTAAQGPDHAAHSLHTANLELRRAYPDKPHLWSAHIHLGP